MKMPTFWSWVLPRWVRGVSSESRVPLWAKHHCKLQWYRDLRISRMMRQEDRQRAVVCGLSYVEIIILLGFCVYFITQWGNVQQGVNT